MGADHEYSDDPAFLLYRALVTGQKIFYATGDGNVNKKTVVCSDLTSVSDQDGNQVHIVDPNSSANGQTRDITGVTTSGTITVGTAFDVQVTEATAFILTGIRSTPVEVAAFETWVKAAIGDASGHTLTSLVTKWGDITRSLDLMLGARWDTSGDLGTDIANIITAIAAIQNNTRFTAAVPVQMCKPDAGNEAFRMASNLYDTEGNMEDPTNNEILVRVIKDDGTYITADLYKENGLSNGLDNATDGTTFPAASGWRAMEREAEGKFFFFMKVANTATEQSLTVELGWTELTKHNYQSRSTEIADVHGDLTTLLDYVDYEGATSLADKLTLIRAGYLDNINNAQLLNVPNLTSLTREHLGFSDGCVWFDATLGSAGTAFPIGTAITPASNIANTQTIAVNNNLRNIQVHGAFQLGQAWEHYSFFGKLHEILANKLDLNGQDVDGSCMRNLLVSGAQGGTGDLILENCFLYAVTNFNGLACCCDLYGSAMSIKDTGTVDLTDCNAIHGALSITLNAPTRFSLKNGKGNCTLTGQDGGTAFVRGFDGSLIIASMTAGTLSIYADSGTDITINVSCAGTGVINTYGDCNVTDNKGSGTTVNDYTIYTRTKGLDDIHDDLVTVDGIIDTISTNTDSKVAGKQQIAKTTEDLNQGAATYDLFTGTTQDVIVESLLIRMPDIVCAGALTSISIQTNDTTPQVLLSAADGAVANLTAEAQLAWQNFNASVLIKTSKKIQLTIAGGAHGVAYVCDVIAKVRAVTSGGYLA